jgi:hypothetical protein
MEAPGGRGDKLLLVHSALDGGEWSASRPGHDLPPEKGPPVPIVQEAGWALEPVWTQRLEEKSFRLCRGSNVENYIPIRELNSIGYVWDTEVAWERRADVAYSVRKIIS